MCEYTHIIGDNLEKIEHGGSDKENHIIESGVCTLGHKFDDACNHYTDTETGERVHFHNKK